MRYMQSRDPRTADRFGPKISKFVCSLSTPRTDRLWIPGVVSKTYEKSSPVRPKISEIYGDFDSSWRTRFYKVVRLPCSFWRRCKPSGLIIVCQGFYSSRRQFSMKFSKFWIFRISRMLVILNFLKNDKN